MYTERYQSRSVAYYAIQIFKVVFLDGTTVGYPQRVLKNLLSIRMSQIYNSKIKMSHII